MDNRRGEKDRRGDRGGEGREGMRTGMERGELGSQGGDRKSRLTVICIMLCIRRRLC